MRRGGLALILLTALALLVAGCGGKTVAPLPQTVIGTVPTQTQPTQTTSTQQLPAGDPTAGKQVFLTAGCTGCHTLKAAGSNGTVGPNLDDAKPDLARIFDRVTNGKGAMPSFKGKLSSKQIADVAAFVYKSTHGG